MAEPDECKLIFILLGPSGSGKTSFGKSSAFTWEHKIMFLSTGDELRKREILSPWQEPDIQTVKVICHEMINKTLEAFKVSKTHSILILDCVKDLGDAEYITLQAKKYGFEISRALLMNVNPGELEFRWKQRGEPRDTLRLGSAISYFHSWRKKFNDVVNYYKKMKVLSLHASNHKQSRDCQMPLKCQCSDQGLDDFFPDKDTLMSDYPALSCSNSIYFQLIDAVKVRNMLAFLLSLLDITRFDFALPASFVHNDDDVTWVANPTRYHVTVKPDGVRFLLVKINEESFLINRKKEIYPCQLENNDLPNNTVLDGELLPSTTFSDIHPKTTSSLKTNVFLSFDVLALAGEILWKWPFSERRVALSQLPISKDVGVVVKEASGDGLATSEKKSEAAPKESFGTEKLAVKVTIKEHYKSTADAIFVCLSSSRNVPYLCDGLVFTPDMPYTFGPDPLLFKWQPEGLIHSDISCIELENGKRRCVNRLALDWIRSSSEEGNSESRLFGRIMECQWNQKLSAWEPLFLRHDKPAPNSDDTINWLEKICQDPYPIDRLVTHLTRIIDDDKMKKDEKSATSPHSKRYPLIHPTMSYSFDELYSLVNQLVQLNEVEKNIELTTSLEIFNYYSSSSPSNPNVQLCRGLVLHPESKTVVTKPFVRFFEDVHEPDLSEIVEATVKFDGSLGIAFQWNNEVKVTTRRRMDSEQAIWAKQWIQDHCNASVFLTGFTYLFEIVYKVNTVIVEYPFQGLVLLAVTDGNGHELPYEEVMHFGKAAGFFMVTPRITGSYSEITWYCGGIHPSRESTQQPRSPLSSGKLPMCLQRQLEGWVVKFKDGRRQKIIHKWWKNVSKVTHLVHPQVVWLLVRHNQIENVFRNIPNHFRREIQRMVKAIARLFYQTLELMRQSILSSHSKMKESKPCKKRKKVTAFMCRLYSGLSELESKELEHASDKEPFNLQEPLVSPDEENVNESKLSKKKSNNIDEITRKRSTLENDDEFQQSNTSDEKERSLQKLLTQAKPYLGNENLPMDLYSPFYKQYGSNHLRLPILDYIRITKPAIDGYKPSDNFQQTMSKGWKTLPNDQRKLIQEVLQEDHHYPPLLQMPNEIMLLVLDFLDGRSLNALCMVCWRLCEILRSKQSLRDKIKLARLKQRTQFKLDAELTRHSFLVFNFSNCHGYGSDG